MCLAQLPAAAKVQPAQYGLQFSVSKEARGRALARSFDSLLRTHPQLSNKNVIVNIQAERNWDDSTADFYLLMGLVLFLGMIRLLDPKYFQQLWRAFRNPTLSNRQLKDQLESSSLPSLLTNIFFTITMGAYIYYLIKLFIPQRTGDIPASLLVLMLILGMMLIYTVKYAVMRFSGWAFKVEGITEHYVFNVFLINKLIGLLLLPFTILIAFAGPAIAGPAVIVSLIAVGLLLINRYTRSWQVFGSFFQYSKFHFFMYLCASELLPLAVLTKLLVRGLA
jgi:hypothetical protein